MPEKDSMTTERSPWFTSSYSMQNGECVQVRYDVPVIAVRDSTWVDGPSLAFPAAAWSAFVAQAKAGRS